MALPDEPPSFERPSHVTRFATLKVLRQAYRSQPEYCIEMEIHQ